MVVLHFDSFVFFFLARESRPAPTWCVCVYFFISSVLSSCCHGLLFISLITAPLRWSIVTLFSSAHVTEHKHPHGCAQRCKRTHTNTRTINSTREHDSSFLWGSTHLSLLHEYTKTLSIYIQNRSMAKQACQELLHPLKTYIHIHITPRVLLKIKTQKRRFNSGSTTCTRQSPPGILTKVKKKKN